MLTFLHLALVFPTLGSPILEPDLWDISYFFSSVNLLLIPTIIFVLEEKSLWQVVSQLR